MKQKTKKSITKRFKITKKGKILHRVSFRKHLNEKKSSKRKRQARRMTPTNKTFAKKLRRFLNITSA